MQKKFPYVTQPMLPDFEPEPETENFQLPEEPVPFDCARYTAWHMVKSAISKFQTPFPPGLYIVQCPRDEWNQSIRRALREIQLCEKPTGKERRKIGAPPTKFHFIDLPEKPDTRQVDSAIDEAQNILANNETAIVIAGNQTVIPALLRQASDHVFIVPPLRRQWIAALIAQIAPGTKRLDFNGLAVETVTPTMLRLAYRRDTTGADFLSRLKELSTPAPKVKDEKIISIDRLHGVDEAKKWASDLKSDLARYHSGEIPWGQISRGLLLSGEPGTAKTTLAQAIAQFCGLAFVPTSYSMWQRRNSGHLGDVMKSIAAIFAEAREKRPSLLFIDEIDSIGARGKEGQRDDWWRAVINGLLPELDGTENNTGIVFMAATNHPDLIDPALVRSGRIEEHIRLRLPDVQALAAIYHDELARDVEGNVNFQHLGRISVGITGADALKICNTARRRARNDRRLIKNEDLLAALSGSQPDSNSEHMRRTAIHESGHAIVALTSPYMHVEHITIIGRGNMGGGTSMALHNTRGSTPAMADACLRAVLAGRAAEKVLLGEISAGSGGPDGCDLARARSIAVDAELTLGLQQQSLIWYASRPPKEFDRLFSARPDLEQVVRARMDRGYAEAIELVKANAPIIRKLAEQLLIAKVMTGAEVMEVVRSFKHFETSSITDRLLPANDSQIE